MKRLLIIFTILLLCISLVIAVNYIKDVLEEGMYKTYDLDGNNYVISLDYVGYSNYVLLCKLTINNIATPLLREKEVYKLENVELKILDISEGQAGEAAGGDKIEFSLTLTCGDGICSNDETCEKDNCCNGQEVNFNTDNSNCGKCNKKCYDNEKCINSNCQTYCGNGICDSEEDCEADDCCDGGEVNLMSDEENCGRCGRECDSYERCRSGRCETFCGNSICDPDETCLKDNCCDGIKVNLNTNKEYCGTCTINCLPYKRCENGKCVAYCGNNVCDDDETCVEDNCCNGKEVSLGSDENNCGGCGNKCEDDEICEDSECVTLCAIGCSSNNGCVQIGTIGLNKEQYVYCNGSDWILKKDLNTNCKFDYECKINSCINGYCQEFMSVPEAKPINIFSRFFSWFKGLFA